MAVTQPIRNKQDIQRVKDAMKADENHAFFTLFTLGINTGLRISDILNLKVEDVFRGKKPIEYLELIEQKTKKRQTIFLNNTIKKALSLYVKNIPPNQVFLFQTFKDPDKRIKPLSYRYVLKMLKYYINERAGININVGTHTMRKTFGYQTYMSGWDIYRVQQCLNHSSPTTTKLYIGLSQEDKDVVYKSIEL